LLLLLWWVAVVVGLVVVVPCFLAATVGGPRWRLRREAVAVAVARTAPPGIAVVTMAAMAGLSGGI
jgi:hypothetical protein